MQKANGNKIRLGIFVSAGVALFMAGIYLIGQRQQLFSSTFHVSGIFNDISGLEVGNNVRFSGIDVGIVENIQQITDSTVKVDMEINEHTKKFIKKTAKAIIGTDGLMGNKIVVISAGAGGTEQIANNDVIATVRPVSMDDIMLKVKITTDNAAEITDGLAVIVENLSRGKGTIGKLFFDSSFANNAEQAMVNIKQGAGGFKQNMDAASHSFLLRGFLKRKERRKERKEEKKEERDKNDN